MLIYIHGFNSSPQSFKARLIEARMAALGLADRFRCPALSHEPGRAMDMLRSLLKIDGGTPPALVGSSLGGYYATRLAEDYGLRAVLLNPAVRPYDLLRAHVGRQKNLYTGVEYELTPAHVGQLRGLEVDDIAPERYLLVVATGDEVLNYRDAVARYRGCRQIVIDGGEHGLAGFADHLDDALRFCGIGLPGSTGGRKTGELQ